MSMGINGPHLRVSFASPCASSELPKPGDNKLVIEIRPDDDSFLNSLDKTLNGGKTHSPIGSLGSATRVKIITYDAIGDEESVFTITHPKAIQSAEQVSDREPAIV